MASIERYKGNRWRARYRTPAGESRSQVFDRKLDAQRWLATVEHSKLTGAYVDPAEGKVTFKSYAEAWAARQVWRPSSARAYATMLGRVYPVIGDRPIASLRPSDLQALVKRLSGSLAPKTVDTTYRAVTAVLRAAVADRVLASTPAAGVKLPKVARRKVQPLEVAQVLALADAMPEKRTRAAVLFAAGSGLRQGEVLGLTVDRVDWLRRTVRVDRQMITPSSGVPEFGPPKSAASHRTVPLAQVTLDGLAAHLARWPAGKDGLIFTTPEGRPWRRDRFAEHVRTARESAGLPETVSFHDLRHHYASVLIAGGCSIKAVQEALGHANAGETLNTYSHLWPADDDRVRDAVAAAHDPARVTLVSQAGSTGP